MIKSSSRTFVSDISNEKPIVMFFHNNEAEVKKIKSVMEKVEKQLPLLPSYEFVLEETEENLLLTDVLEVQRVPILVVFKDGCFNRYKNKGFSEKTILNFVGNKKLYAK